MTSALRTIADPSSRDRLIWAVRVRWLVIGGFFVLAVLGRAFGLFASIQACLVAALLGSVLNSINHWCVRCWRAVLPVTAVALAADLLLITYVSMSTGGVRSPFVTMYVIQVLATAMLVDTAVAGATAVIGVSLFGAALAAEAWGLYHGSSLGDPVTGPLDGTLAYRVVWSAFFLYALTLLVFLGGYISERLRASERDLGEKHRRLTEANAQLAAAYERLKQTEAHLIQSEKMHALGQLVAGVAHELNNPISFVSANIEHLRLYIGRLKQLIDAYDATALPAPDRERIEQLKDTVALHDLLADLPGLLADCEEGAQRTKRIVGELRTFSRSDEFDRWRPVDLHECIESTLALLGHRLKEGIRVHRRFGDIPEVECLPGQINQVVMNLLANAIDAIGGKGNIWITTGREPSMQGASGNGCVTLSIRDDGVGMAPDIKARIFDPFFTTKEVGKGTGLGLSVSYSIVERHGGSLRAESALGVGSTFTVRLPIEQPSA
jgi:two-component system, NtrC family, sensor kinase